MTYMHHWQVYPRVCGGTRGSSHGADDPNGLSPRVRGNRVAPTDQVLDDGSIPACAGEPIAIFWRVALLRVYPRVCGGTRASLLQFFVHAGLSPRVRGNPREIFFRVFRKGSIPACAGEPTGSTMIPTTIRVYPRVCGGTLPVLASGSRKKGLSPRVRGNQPTVEAQIHTRGSIPACAGEPIDCIAARRASWVYPRVCGGTGSASWVRNGKMGLSPRVRGNPHRSPTELAAVRSIPACAGEPYSGDSACHGTSVYPRVCGGTTTLGWLPRLEYGLSPRVRGNPIRGPLVPCANGSIPACAGEPAASSRRCQTAQVYPRVCGGTTGRTVAHYSPEGLSPRVRGNPSVLGARCVFTRSIPACAGEPRQPGL